MENGLLSRWNRPAAGLISSLPLTIFARLRFPSGGFPGLFLPWNPRESPWSSGLSFNGDESRPSPTAAFLEAAVERLIGSAGRASPASGGLCKQIPVSDVDSFRLWRFPPLESHGRSTFFFLFFKRNPVGRTQKAFAFPKIAIRRILGECFSNPSIAST